MAPIALSVILEVDPALVDSTLGPDSPKALDLPRLSPIGMFAQSS